MWQNIIIFIIIVACLFFIGHRIRRQLKGGTTGCGCSGGCGGCAVPSAKTKDCETKEPPSLQ